MYSSPKKTEATLGVALVGCGFAAKVQDFCEATATGSEPLSGSLLGKDVVAVCYSAYLSAATGKRVDVPKV